MKNALWCGSSLLAGVLVAGLLAVSGLPCTITLRPGDSLQVAVDEAQEGDVLCLSRGTWTEHVVVRRSITLRGAGSDRTEIRGIEYGQPVVRVTGTATAVLEELSIRDGVGAGLERTLPSAGLLVTDNAQAEVIACRLEGNNPVGLLVQDTARAHVARADLSNNRRFGAVIRGEGTAILSQSSIEENAQGGIWISGDGRLEATDIVVAKNGSTGLWVRDQAVMVLGSSLVEDNQGYGMRVQNNARAVIQACQVIGNQDPGATLLDHGHATFNETSLHRNWLGILVSDNASADVEACHIKSNRWEAIRLTGEAEARVVRSLMEDGTSALLMTGRTEALVVESEIRGFRIAGISSYGHKLAGHGNRMRDNTIDVLGNVPGGFRVPLREPSEDAITFPNEAYPTLQHAVDALRDGGVLNIQAGTHASSTTVERGIVFVGEPGARLESAHPDAPVLSLVGQADVRLQRLELEGGAIGLAAGSEVQAVLEDVAIRSNEMGIMLWNSAVLTLQTCEVTANTDDGLTISHAATANLMGCVVSNNGGNGIQVWNEARVAIENSKIEGNHEHGVHAGLTSELEIRDTTVTQSMNGIMMRHGSRGTIAGVTVADNNTGIFLEGSTRTSVRDCTVTGNEHGIYIRDAANALIEGNHIYDNSRFGVTMLESLFSGSVTGGGNVIDGPEVPRSRFDQALSTRALAFLKTEEGGTFEPRR